MKTIRYTREALKTLTQIPANVAKRIRSKIEQYASDPASLANNIKALKGLQGTHRLRVGDWRVIFTEDGEIIAIKKIAPRGGAYD
ncbi:RelE/StbE family addiction module toxin [Sinorhizobium fredii USDA 205]|uniref:Type II toxin-antitoxin system RelE/ParE family toxin n=2 Tax=Rhizobium fredii TaxID=380 RepID=A0A2A6LVB1_RHIFR|nr:type II toxin-antitoxin system RelE/ParE family toxin [Sinorhizobium fredii]ASY67582.1 RelE/StbE replicon stabilization toxin [Sinorhizobium fredii CCBAU 83666]AWM23419.1 RelE/StbE replicon stabilization toxin [Sinorhizobium fredii CCBAU 25509]KSV92593.1 RelE/StbE family addiction module toxin [Sinorhizobium fredii USDA 205]MQW95098.1 type II toxin-antitoxin system RelE/ParE family toxin [Sinorhizobium fredii]MQX10908.1 type II toxin-antitoxin system RelE/ParE family toxin [Sinorhizobium fr